MNFNQSTHAHRMGTERWATPHVYRCEKYENEDEQLFMFSCSICGLIDDLKENKFCLLHIKLRVLVLWSNFRYALLPYLWLRLPILSTQKVPHFHGFINHLGDKYHTSTAFSQMFLNFRNLHIEFWRCKMFNMGSLDCMQCCAKC